MGNYAYCGAIRKLMDVPVQFRILALSATPGSKKQSIQQVIDNLHISTLEYRNESDKDVSPYVHNKDIELIEVPIGKDAEEANDLLSNVIHPFLARLCSLRVLHNRDVNAWGPPELLNWREKFRQAPPPDLSQANYGEVEGYFGILISLYHIRKLLSSHGIKPAFEMLEDKLRQGPFAKIMGRNEGIHQVKLIMQRSLSHGAPTPKLAKLLEVVTDHFNTKDPQSSRIIIFSNFRGSVRDIMSKLVTVGDNVKPTEFIGQSSGKTLKGQTQKIQQAVLKKFRDGGYNVIVATSIGEEGLDIMEVDLVICFDANVSPLRMVQRMGRTGRKHDGRVVVLACEGPEVKGYRKKLAFSNSMKKQLRNGGITNYTFHSSPRMVPHIFKPAVQYVELSIEQFVQRGKAVKDVPITQSPTPIEKLNDSEIQLLLKYFPTGGNCTLNLSLIAFPSCQLFPSRVNTVKHSFRSGMLIDSMQLLHGFSDNGNSRVISAEEETFCGGECISISNDQSDFKSPNKYLEPQLSGDAHSSPSSHFQDNEFVGRHDSGGYGDKENHFHCHPFQSEFITVDPLGRKSVAPAPTLHYKDDASRPTRQPNLANDLTMEGNKILDPKLFEINQLPESPKPVKNISQKEDANSETPDIVAHGMSILECQQDAQLSPRLTNFMLSGVVPESPEFDTQNDEDGYNSPNSEYSTPIKPCRDAVLQPSNHEVVCAENGTTKRNSGSSNEGTRSPRVCTSRTGIQVASPAVSEEPNIPLIDLTSENCSKDRLPNSGNKTETVERPRRLKRLRRHRDYLAASMVHKRIADADPSSSPFKYPRSAAADTTTADEVKAFFDEEAVVSSGSNVSGDEEEEENCNSYEDSFINDKTSPSEVTTQAEASTVDMMAIYRRSLLSQSPLVRMPEFSNNTDDFTPLKLDATGNGSISSKMTYSNSERQIQHGTNSTAPFDSDQLNPKGIVLSDDPCSSSRFSAVNYHNGSRKRKLSSHKAEIILPINLEKQFFSHSETARPEPLPTVQADKTELNPDIFGDEAFFEGLDLDAIEAQATMLFQSKTKDQSQKQDTYDEPSTPTFDLGI